MNGTDITDWHMQANDEFNINDRFHDMFNITNRSITGSNDKMSSHLCYTPKLKKINKFGSHNSIDLEPFRCKLPWRCFLVHVAGG
jgi:hypothetical protein